MKALADKFKNSSLPIALKWSLLIVSFITLTMSALGWFLINQQSEFHTLQNRQLGNALANQLAKAASEPMLAQDDLALGILVEKTGDEPLIIGMQIFDKEGNLRAHSGISPISDINSLLAKDSFPEHLNWQTDSIQAITFYSPIEYQGVTAGMALVSIDQLPLEAQLSHTRRVLISTTAGIVFISILLAFPLGYRIYAPIKELVDIGNTVSANTPPPNIRSERRDEIGRVLDSFHSLAGSMEQKKKVEDAFSQFLSPSIAKQVLSQPSGTQLGGKTVNGSVLFCDVVGFTEISEILSPTEVGELLNEYFRHFSIAAESCQGTVDKFIGDCIMILFGIPDNDDNHGLHAVSCGVLIQHISKHITKHRQKQGLPTVEFRIGINSGDMLAGNLGSEGRMQFTVVGDVVNLASRMCTLSDTGGVLITQETLDQSGLRSVTQHNALGAVMVKGRNQPVYPYAIDLNHFIRQSDIEDYFKEFFPDGELSE
jgi:adenylate cyclase